VSGGTGGAGGAGMGSTSGAWSAPGAGAGGPGASLPAAKERPLGSAGFAVVLVSVLGIGGAFYGHMRWRATRVAEADRLTGEREGEAARLAALRAQILTERARSPTIPDATPQYLDRAIRTIVALLDARGARDLTYEQRQPEPIEIRAEGPVPGDWRTSRFKKVAIDLSFAAPYEAVLGILGDLRSLGDACITTLEEVDATGRPGALRVKMRVALLAR